MKTDPVVLRRLGPVPFWRGQEKCLESLRRIYERAMESARRRLGSATPPRVRRSSAVS